MLIELTEALACPACLRRGTGVPNQGLIAVVDELRARRVLQGYLGCSYCESRYSIRDAAITFGAEPSGGQVAPAASPPEVEGGESVGRPGWEPRDPEELAVEVAALLGVAERPGGVWLLGEGLAHAARKVAGLAAGAEVLVLAGGDPPAGTEELTVARDTPPDVLPILSGRLRGVALRGGTADRVREGSRALGVGGRLVLLAPSQVGRQAVAESDLRILADEDRALVAVRP